MTENHQPFVNSEKGKHVQSNTSDVIFLLNDIFKSFDIDDEGELDEGSFISALLQLGVNLSSSDLDKIFTELDINKTGYIKYDKVLKFLKMGKIPSTLLNTIKGNDVKGKNRQSVFIGSKPSLNRNLSRLKSEMSSNTIAPEMTEQQKLIHKMEKKTNKKRLKIVNRAIIVIKKASIKNVGRSDVTEFLKEKGMNDNEIELAYLKAQENVMSIEEQIKYLQQRNQEKTNEIKELQILNTTFTQKITEHTIVSEQLRTIIKIAATELLKTFTKKYNYELPEDAIIELTKRMKKTKIDIENSIKMKNDNAIAIHKSDLEGLTTVSKCLLDKEYFHAFLYLNSLSHFIQNSMPSLVYFLKKFNNPEN